eukprot:TRINITY_DN2206_c0_g1_i2.p1 TRINITY_DN2206_c0_g1~~TRINITY_DN2206_c0_g1_i2.p1  ORF type:complete len:565 (-),score=173.04 TRINITY_DN2206_c0_g1_i2:943-2637(-)
MAEVESQRKREGGEKRGPRLQRPVLPSAEPMKQKVSLLREEINKRQDRITEIKAILDKSRGGARGAESRAVQNELGEIRGEFNKLLNQKKALREQLQQSDQTREQVRSSAKQLKEKLQYTSVAEIDKQMKLLEDKLNYEDVGGIQNEKKIIERIKQLAESRKFVQSYSSKIGELEKGKDSRQEITERLDKLNSQLDALSAQEKGLKSKLDEQRNQRGKQEDDRDSLTTEKQDCYEIIKASRDQITSLQQDYNEEFEQYKVKLEEYRKQAAVAKEERDAQYKAERDAKNEERKKRDLELAGAPYSEHILRCDQLIQFLSKYVSPEETCKEESAELSGNNKSGIGSDLSGMKMIRRKGEEQDDPLAGTLTRTNKGGGKKGKKGAKANSTSTASKKMVLDLDLITAFKFVGVRTPGGTEEASDILKEVQAKKEEYKEKQNVAEKTGVLNGSSGKEETADDQAIDEAGEKEKEQVEEDADGVEQGEDEKQVQQEVEAEDTTGMDKEEEGEKGDLEENDEEEEKEEEQEQLAEEEESATVDQDAKSSDKVEAKDDTKDVTAADLDSDDD